MGWHGETIWLGAVGQGALEGAIHGVAYAAIFVVLIAYISDRRCELATAMRYAGLTFGLSFAFWLVGGLTPIVIAVLFPRLQYHQFFGYAWTWTGLVRYGWVHGSILGAVYGGLCSVFVTNAVYTLRVRSTFSH